MPQFPRPSVLFLYYFIPAGLLEVTSETQVPTRRKKCWKKLWVIVVNQSITHNFSIPRVCRVLAGRWGTQAAQWSEVYFFSLGTSFPPWALKLIGKPKGLQLRSSEPQQHGFPLLKRFSPTLLHYYPTCQV